MLLLKFCHSRCYKGNLSEKILFFSGATVLLSACSLFGPSQSPIPAEFAQADYLLSDVNAKTWATASKQAERCIYPNLTRIQQQHFAKEDSYIHSPDDFF